MRNKNYTVTKNVMSQADKIEQHKQAFVKVTALDGIGYHKSKEDIRNGRSVPLRYMAFNNGSTARFLIGGQGGGSRHQKSVVDMGTIKAKTSARHQATRGGFVFVFGLGDMPSNQN